MLYPHLYNLAVNFCARQPPLCPVKDFFSKVGEAICQRRKWLKPATAEKKKRKEKKILLQIKSLKCILCSHFRLALYHNLLITCTIPCHYVLFSQTFLTKKITLFLFVCLFYAFLYILKLNKDKEASWSKWYTVSAPPDAIVLCGSNPEPKLWLIFLHN